MIQKLSKAEYTLDSKRIDQTVTDPPGWNNDEKTVMEERIAMKAGQVGEVEEKTTSKQ